MTGEKRLTHAEVFEEIDWLLAADIHPELIAQTLNRTVSAIEKMARRWGRPDIYDTFKPYIHRIEKAA